MLAGSVTRSTSTPASPILNRVLASRSSYSSSGNAATCPLLGRLSAEQKMLEHGLSRVEVIEDDPLVRPVRGLLDVARSDQNAWEPRAVDDGAGVAGCPPGRDVVRNVRFGHPRRHLPHQDTVLRLL